MNHPISRVALPVTAPAIVALSHLRLVDVTGPDAAEFFQAQVSNDLHALSTDTAQLNGYCHPKGRLLALFTVLPVDNGYRLILPADIVESFVKRLKMFVMRAQVSVEPKPNLQCLGLMCPEDASTLPLQTAKAMPSEPLHWNTNDELTCLRWYDSVAAHSNEVSGLAPENTLKRFILIAPEAQSERILASAELQTVSEQAWRWADINAGIPSVTAANVEQFVPQMMNLQFLEGLSFKKGCYPGQEIVARMQYLGKLKRHMRAFRWTNANTEWCPTIGDALSCAEDAAAGRVVDAVADTAGGVVLAVVKVGSEALELDGHVLEPLELPYSIVAEEKS